MLQIGRTTDVCLNHKVVICKWKKEKEVNQMEITMIVALVLAIPVILFPAAFVWYLNIGGVVHAVREARIARAKKAVTTT